MGEERLQEVVAELNLQDGRNYGVRGGREGRVWVGVIPGAKLR